jgi:hypothetical protein
MRAVGVRRAERVDLLGALEEGVGDQQVVDELAAAVEHPGESLARGDTRDQVPQPGLVAVIGLVGASGWPGR